MPTDGATGHGPEGDAVLDLTAFLVASARGAVEESVLTASLRLLHAASRLARVAPIDGLASSPAEALVSRLAARIDAEATGAYLTSEATYVELLDELLAMVAEGIRAGAGLAEEGWP